jgi:hypothetical protein
MTDTARTSATGHADPAFNVRESLSILDALDGIDDRLRGAAGVVALIADRSAAQGVGGVNYLGLPTTTILAGRGGERFR